MLTFSYHYIFFLPSASTLPQPFSKYNDQNAYAGIYITENLVSSAILGFLISREKYRQYSFQHTRSHGASTDHAFKYVKGVRAGKRKGRPFTSTYGNLSLNGQVDFLRMCSSKSPAELTEFMMDYKESRITTNAPRIKVHTSDSLAGDGNLWNNTFKEELNEDVVKPTIRSSSKFGLPMLGIDVEERVEYLCHKHDMIRVADCFYNKYSGMDIDYGFDGEWNRGELGMRIFGISFPNEQVKLFDLNAAGIVDETTFPFEVKRLLEHKRFVPSGVNVAGDCTRMLTFGVRMRRFYELMDIGKIINPAMESYGMAYLVREFLKKDIDKFGQHADYSQSTPQSPLIKELQEYLAIDTAVSRLLLQTMRKYLSEMELQVVLPPSSDLKIEEQVTLVLGNQKVAKVIISELGSAPGKGPAVRWGAKKLERDCAVVEISEVLYPSVTAPYSYRANNKDVADKSWKKEFMNMQKLYELKLPFKVKTSSLLQNIISVDEEGGTDDDILNVSNNERSVRRAAKVQTRYGSNDYEDGDPLLHDLGDDDEDEGVDIMLKDLFEYIPRSRQKEDIFHWFQDVPLGKLEPLRHIILRLLIHATFVPNDEDFERVKAFLRDKLHLECANDEIELENALLDHFYHNREWWYKHCRMTVPAADEHASRILSIVTIMKADKELTKLFDTKMDEYFEKFRKAILKGEFEELHDTPMYINFGVDSHGLPIYYRLRGTNRNENFHQKMKTAIGPWKIGVRTAHYLLVHLAYEYNVETAIRRCGAYDFGMCELDIIDNIQRHVQELYNVLIWPRHKNITIVGGKDDFISVGIGPLTYDERFVELSDVPAAHLKGDLRFIASQMKLKYPALPIDSVEEVKLFRDFIKNNKPTRANIERLCQVFKEKSDGKIIFPKTPYILNNYLTTWKKNNEIKAREKELGPDARCLMRCLFFVTKPNFEADKLTLDLPTGTGHTAVDADIDRLANTIDESDISEERIDFASIDEEPDESSPTLEQQPPPLFVPPIQAPNQTSYIPAISLGNGFNNEARICLLQHNPIL